MSEKEEEFPFEEFVEALAEAKDLRKSLKNIIGAISEKNMYLLLDVDIGRTLLSQLWSK